VGEQLQFPEEVGLTDERKYGKTYAVGSPKESDTVILASTPTLRRVFELPHVAHAGPCFVAFELGDQVDECLCFTAIDEELI